MGITYAGTIREALENVMLNYCRSMVLLPGILLWMISLSSFAQAGGIHADTLNRMDELGKKNGWWRIMAPIAGRPNYPEGAVYEEGRYTNSKRTGLWRRYWPDGKVMSEITYQNGRPRGDYTIFYPNGKVEEQGSWDLDRNTGRFLRWHPNGRPAQEFSFTDHGQRDGEQKYYHDNGQLAVVVNVKEGKEEGTLKRYTPSGELQQMAEFNGGVINEANSRYIKPFPKAVDVRPDPAAAVAPEVTVKETTNAIAFRANGPNTLYDEQLRLSQQGEFRNGRLQDGRRYIYDENGLLVRIQVYKGGRYAGDAVITSEDRGY